MMRLIYLRSQIEPERSMAHAILRVAKKTGRENSPSAITALEDLARLDELEANWDCPVEDAQ